MPLRRFVQDHAVETANTLTVGSLGTFTVSWLAELDHIISIVAGVVAIIAGAAALYFHILNIKKIKDDSKDES